MVFDWNLIDADESWIFIWFWSPTRREQILIDRLAVALDLGSVPGPGDMLRALFLRSRLCLGLFYGCCHVSLDFFFFSLFFPVAVGMTSNDCITFRRRIKRRERRDEWHCGFWGGENQQQQQQQNFRTFSVTGAKLFMRGANFPTSLMFPRGHRLSTDALIGKI